jgi:hypothetical protein
MYAADPSGLRQRADEGNEGAEARLDQLAVERGGLEGAAPVSPMRATKRPSVG